VIPPIAFQGSLDAKIFAREIDPGNLFVGVSKLHVNRIEAAVREEAREVRKKYR